MITKKTLKPGRPGTKKWLDKYGDDLLYVRYKYDAQNQKKYITVELIAESQTWEPNKKLRHPNKIVKIKVAYGEVDIGKQIRSLGAIWNRKEKVWEILLRHVIALGLEDRIVEEKE